MQFTERLAEYHSKQGGGSGSEPYWTRENVIERIQAWHTQYGYWPRSRDWDSDANPNWTPRAGRWHGEWPSKTTVEKLFGSMGAGVDAAGRE